jgi:ABC-2 type transport system permease protein
MFGHIFVNRLRCLVRNREKIFWTLLFPIVLAFFFKMAFGNLGKAEAFSPIPVVVAENEAWEANLALQETLNGLNQGEDRLLSLKIASEGEANRMLREGKVSGIIVPDSPVRLETRGTGMNQNILKSVLDSFNQYSATIATLIREDPSRAAALLANMPERGRFTRDARAGNAPMDPSVVYFFGLIAMACFYGGFFGSDEITDIQADITPRAARINVAPVHKMKTFLFSASASLLIHLLETIVFVLFLHFVLDIGFGSRIWYILLTVVSGSLAGVSFGACISALVKKSEALKTSLLIGITMIGSALAGMMYADVKYVIATKAPILTWINPVNLLADAFYSLYFHDTVTRFYMNLGALALMTLVFGVITFLAVRRTRYASL